MKVAEFTKSSANKIFLPERSNVPPIFLNVVLIVISEPSVVVPDPECQSEPNIPELIFNVAPLISHADPEF